MAANYTTDSIRIFKDDSSKTVENAFNDEFYGPGASGKTEADGYPDATLSNLPFTVADYEITAPVDLGEVIDITNNTTTVIADGAVFTSGDVGKFLWDASTPTALKLIGKILTYVANDEVELDSPYLGTTLTGATCYISSSSNNNANFSTNGEFIVLIKTAQGEEDADKRIFPNNNSSNPFSLKTTSTVNSEYNVSGELNTNYITLVRISDKGVKGKPVSVAAVPATIQRLNTYVSNGANNFFRDTNDFPLWVAYKINPFGNTGTNFSKNTAYSLEISEEMPYYTEIFYNVPKTSASQGYF
jgi:hypothetical protein